MKFVYEDRDLYPQEGRGRKLTLASSSTPTSRVLPVVRCKSWRFPWPAWGSRRASIRLQEEEEIDACAQSTFFTSESSLAFPSSFQGVSVGALPKGKKCKW